MRRLLLLASVGVMGVGLGCNHTAGVCDCDVGGYGTPPLVRPLPLPPPPPPGPAPAGHAGLTLDPVPGTTTAEK